MKVETSLMKGDRTEQWGVSGVDISPTDFSALNNNDDQFDYILGQKGVLPAVTSQSCNYNYSEMLWDCLEKAKAEQSLLIQYLSDAIFHWFKPSMFIWVVYLNPWFIL